MLLGDKSLREKLGKRAYKFIKDNFSIDLIADMYIELYEELV